MGWDAPRPDAPAVATRSEGQGRRRLAPGLEPRAATHRSVWAEHGEDPPFARSEHRGAFSPRDRRSYPQRKSSSSLSSIRGGS
jgi:hypothetical protein